jgi:hypothetical protein
MLKRRMLGEKAKRGRPFEPGNRAALGNRSLPAVRRNTNRLLLTTLWDELMEVDPQSRQTYLVRLIRKAKRSALLSDNACMRLLEFVMDRFLGKATLPVLWAQVNDPGASAKTIELIGEHHNEAEAARMMQDTLRADDEEDATTRSALDRERRLDSGPDDDGRPIRTSEPSEAEVRAMVGDDYAPDDMPDRKSSPRTLPAAQDRDYPEPDIEADPLPDRDPPPDEVEDYDLPRRRRSKYAAALDRIKPGKSFF